VTDGTTAGTHEITVNGAGSGGIVPYDLTVFNNAVLFAGYDAANNVGLWVTDGTTAGTHEITVNGAYSTGVHPRDLTVFNHEVLFAGDHRNQRSKSERSQPNRSDCLLRGA
jgi:ELWxxDGT repeat protein